MDRFKQATADVDVIEKDSIVLVRDKRGFWLVRIDPWLRAKGDLEAMLPRTGEGAGALAYEELQTSPQWVGMALATYGVCGGDWQRLVDEAIRVGLIEAAEARAQLRYPEG